ncbi:CGNR zinc finger domain-containing protein [Streptomyces sp. NPDC051320]|uniref:CGNR zinc finger domain-containing protein n=1 Tax=Streptomyces sp. NPDC051320 TaxID=3154644 RepID=UPI003425E3D4
MTPTVWAGAPAAPRRWPLAVGSELAGRLGVCWAPRCDRVYVDASRNSVRQFCCAPCQSRVKAAAFRARRGTGSE